MLLSTASSQTTKRDLCFEDMAGRLRAKLMEAFSRERVINGSSAIAKDLSVGESDAPTQTWIVPNRAVAVVFFLQDR